MQLVLENVTKNFGGLRAVGDVTFTVPEKVIFGLIGPNGAGKTTVFNLVTGVYKPDSGSVRFGATDLGPLKPAQIAGTGVGRTFQNIRLFGQLTVIENLLVACELQKKAHLTAAIFRLPIHYEDEAAMHARALELLRVFDLHEMADEAPTSLSYGNQRRLEIARAMMLNPKILLLDEPAAGMNYGEAEGLKTQIRWLRDTFDLSVVLVEHNMQVVMGVCEEIHVLDHGETITHGTPDEVRKHPKVLAAYLGEDEGAPDVRAAVERASSRDVTLLSGSRGSAEGGTRDVDPPPPPPPPKLSEPEVEGLSKELRRSIERGLSRPDASEIATVEGEADKADKASANVGGVEVVTEPEAPPTKPAAPAADVAKVDRGWSDSDLSKHDGEPASKKETNGTNGVNGKDGKE